MNPKSLQNLQTKALKLLVDISNSEVERSSSMRNLIISTIKSILDFPYKGDSHNFLAKILTVFRDNPTNIEILELISLFLTDCEKKKSMSINFFSKEFSYLENLDLFRLYYNFLYQMGPKLTRNGPLIDTFFLTLESLIMKQKKPNRLSKEYFLQLWNFICGNDFRLLKDKFSSFVVSNYTRFLYRFDIYPSIFSNSSLEKLLKLKNYYRNLPGGIPSERTMRENFHSKKNTNESTLEVSHIPTEITLGMEEQMLFKMLFLIENSVTSKPKIKLLSSTLSDELFVTLTELSDLKGYIELWYMVNFLPGTQILQEFLIKLFRFHDPQYPLFYLETDFLNIAKLDERQLSGKKKNLVKKYKITQKKSKPKEPKVEKTICDQIEKRRFQLCVQVIKNLKSAIEYDNQLIISNMLDLLQRYLLTSKGFLGQIEINLSDSSLLDEEM
jgi:hypothetical protein